MRNQEVAKLFEQIADLLEIKGGDRFRVNSYRRAARIIDDLSEDVGDLSARGDLQKIDGIGKGTADRIHQYLTGGKIDLHQELLASLPPGLPALLEIPSLGPKKVGQLHKELGITGIDDLAAALADGRVEQLGGFGKKSVEKIQEGIAFLSESAGRIPLGVAWPLANTLRDKVAELPGVQRVEIAGSVRRGRETVGDLDLLCVADDGEKIIKTFTNAEEVTGRRGAGKSKASVLVLNPEGGEIQVDLRVVSAESFGAALHYFTGSKEHNVRLRERAVRKGWKLNEYGLYDGDKLLAGATEAEIYDRLGLAFIPPELREDRGEFEQNDTLPELVTRDDLRGDLHMHTTASDGRNSIEEMATAAKERGYEYLAITEHSRSSAIANGLSIDKLQAHAEAIRAANKKIKGITILAGIECDILADGSLDYPDEVLAELDWVGASIHTAQGQDRDRVTGRTCDAIANPYVNVIGHPSGRLLNKRDAMDMDWEKVFATAAATGTALEVSASWQRLDLKDLHIRQAIAAGAVVCISTDAHRTESLDQIHFGIRTARRGWASKENVVNTWPLSKVKKWIQAKRG